MKLIVQRLAVILVLTLLGCQQSITTESGQICVDELQILLLDQGPNDATMKMETYHPIGHHRAVHRCGRKSISHASFYQEIYQYRTTNRAIEEYENQLEDFFTRNEFLSEWDTIDTPNLQLDAEQHQIACSELDTGALLCKMMARYGETIVYLSANMSQIPMSLDEFVWVITEVDAKFRGEAE